jgi:2-polyprenyl-3-methyl-5-hydroxy-6-metoxy-1,4-benzoquinol methylase
MNPEVLPSSATMTGIPPSPQLFLETANAYQRTEALRAAVELDVFSAIGEGKPRIEEIANRCKASIRGTRILCDFLVVHGLLKKTAVFLDQRSPAYMGGTLRFLNAPSTMETFKNLAEIVRRGTSTNEDRLTPQHPIWVEFARSMAPLMKMPAELLATMLGADQGANWKVLSLAAGHGIYEVTLARHNRNAEVWAVDWANVLEVARENAAAAGVADRYHTIPGSAFDVEYGAGFDLALVVNFLHHFAPGTCEKLLKKLQTSLRPGGRVVIVEFVPHEDRPSPALPASFSLMMLAGTREGDAYTFKEFEQMLRNAGFRCSEMHPLPPTFFDVVIGTK